MSQASVKQVDCRGQQCPAPILNTTRAARALGAEGGVLRVVADDDAFPKDIEAWCQSTSSKLVELTREEGAYVATVSVRGLAKPSQEPARDAAVLTLLPRPEEETVLDCRGLVCPAPIVRVSRAAKTATSSRLRVLADDPAFEVDIRAWCLTSGHKLERVEPNGNGVTVVIGLVAQPTVAPVLQAPLAPPLPSARIAPIHAERPQGGCDVRGLSGPARIQAVMAAATSSSSGSITALADDFAFAQELSAWCAMTGNSVRRVETTPEGVSFEVALEPADRPAPARPGTGQASRPVVQPPLLESAPTPQGQPQKNACSILILHNDLEALLAAMLVANGALAQGMEVSIFFSFWGLNLLRGESPRLDVPVEKTSWMQRMMKWMMPRGPKRQKLGQMNFGGAGKAMLGHIMKDKGIMDLPALLESARENGARFVACTMSMSVMGITRRDLMPLDNLEFGGVAAYVADAAQSRMTLTF